MHVKVSASGTHVMELLVVMVMAMKAGGGNDGGCGVVDGDSLVFCLL